MSATAEALDRAPEAADDRGVGEAEPLPGGGVTSTGKPVFTLDQIVAQLDRARVRWVNSPVVTYAFYDVRPSGLPASVGFAPLSEEMRQLTRQAFATISDVVRLQFAETASPGGYGRAATGINIYGDSSAPDYVWGTTFRYTNGPASIASAFIEVNPAAVAARKAFVGGYNFLADMHEILHALGVSHPGDYNADGSTITYASNAAYSQDSRQYTVMSYFDPTNTGANFVPPGETAAYSLSTLGLHDIAALQALYGASNARATDTVYGYNSTAGLAAYDASLNNHPIFSIWDAGGIDTLDLSGSPLPARLNLNAGEFSDTSGLVGNISIAYGVTVENAKGGSADDTLVGNGAANGLDGGPGDDLLEGRGGDDTLTGGAGTDTAAYGARAADYDWWWDAAGQAWIVDDARAAPSDGTDRLVSVEKLAFTDATVTLGPPPTTPAALLDQAFARVLRTPQSSADASFLSGLSSQVEAGALTLAQAYGQVTARALGGATVATLSYQFFTGRTPTRAGLDYLLAADGPNPNSLNSPYYQGFSVENRFINFAVNLGKLGEGAATFQATFGASSLFEATRTAYAAVFGAAPSDAKLRDILDATFQLNGTVLSRAQYFATYGGDGVEGIGTKAAMAGWLMAEAAKADVGVYARSNDAFLLDLADGARTRVDLIGAYNKAEYALGYGGGG